MRALLSLILFPLAVAGGDLQLVRSDTPPLGTVVHDYGRGMVLVSDAAARGRAVSRPEIRVGRYRFDPADGLPATPAVLSAFPAGEPALHLVQFIGPIDSRWRESLEATGEVLDYVPHHAYLVWAELDALDSIRAVPTIRAIVPFLPAFKVDGDLLEFAATSTEVAVLVAARRADEIATMARLERLGLDIERRDHLLAQLLITATVDAGNIVAVASDPEVIALTRRQPPQLDGEVADRIVDGSSGVGPGISPPGYLQFLADRGVDGSGVTVAVIDSGIDETDPSGHLVGRVASALRGAPPGTTGHGHHVAGIIAGDCSHLVDPDGYLWGLGVAPGAALINIPAFYSGYTGSEQEQVRDAVTTLSTNGVAASIASCSWNLGYGADYTLVERRWDAFARDADDLTAGNQPLLLSFSSGNDGPGPMSLTRPHAGKNIITVGNSETYRPALGRVDFNRMNLTSSRGPTADGRVKPDLAAPGTAIASARSGFFNCGFAAIDGEHMYCSGTSMAQPMVAGAAALFTEWWQLRSGGARPSPALIKAALINGAVDMAETPDGPPVSTGSIPNPDEGWGRLDIGRSVEPELPTLYVDQSILLSGTGESHRVLFAVADRSQPLDVSLVWTDAPAIAGADPALVNDLDVVVQTSLGVRWLGNAMADGWSDPSSSASDALNNVERIRLERPFEDLYSLEVVAQNLPGDGVPGVGDATDQDFALVISNAVQPSEDGVVSFLGANFRCGVAAEILVYDSGLGASVDVMVDSTTEPAGELVTLLEVSPGAHFYRGSIAIVAGPPMADGQLQAASGDQLTVTYVDADDGSGGFGVSKSSLAAVDCVAPTITAVWVSARTDRSAIITWSTDEPATSVVAIVGSSPRVVAADALVTSHSVEVDALVECGRYAFEVRSIDDAGNQATDDNGGLYYDLVSDRRDALYVADFEVTDGGFRHHGVLDEWEWGAALAGPPAAHGGDRLWGTDLDGKYAKDGLLGIDGNFILVSPPVELPPARPATLRFWHWFSIASDGDTDDGGWIEVWDGASWVAVTPRRGYGSSVDADAPARSNGDDAAFAGYGTSWQEVEVDLASFAGSTVRIKLHLYEEDRVLSAATGWYVDDFEVFTLASCRRGSVAATSAVGCGGSLLVSVRDVDLNLDPDAIDNALVYASSPTEVSGEVVLVTETAPNSSRFSGSLAIVSGAATPDGQLQVVDGDAIGVTYADADDGDGQLTWAFASSRADCIAPLVGAISVEGITDQSALVTWWTDELATSRVDYGPTVALGSSVEDRSLVRRHRVLVEGLTPCATSLFRVASSDGVGQTTVEDRGGQMHRLVSWTRDGLAFIDDFESDLGWTLEGEWERATPRGLELRTSTSLEPHAAVSGTEVLGVDLTGLGAHPGDYEPGVVLARATSPAIDCSGLSTVELGFDRWLGVQLSSRDLATVEISGDGGGAWTELYRNPALGDINDRFWTAMSFDVTTVAAGASDVRVRFAMSSDASTELMGWQLDDLVVRDPGRPPYRSCGSSLRYQAHRVDDGGGGDGDLIAEPGETVRVPIVLTNAGVVTATSIVGVVGADQPGLYAITQVDVSWPDLAVGQSVESTIHVELAIDSCAPLGTVIPLIIAGAATDGPFTIGAEVVVGGGIVSTTAIAPPLVSTPIPDRDPSGVVIAMTGTESAPVTAVEVEVEIVHADAGQLIVSLTAPDGTVVALHDRSDAGLPFGTRRYPPQLVDGPGRLEELVGQPGAGEWRLRVLDARLGQTGTLERVELTLRTRQPSASTAGSVSSPLLVVRNGQDVDASWGVAPGASSYALSRASSRSLSGLAPVATAASPAATDPGVVASQYSFYYSIAGLDACGREGP